MMGPKRILRNLFFGEYTAGDVCNATHVRAPSDFLSLRQPDSQAVQELHVGILKKTPCHLGRDYSLLLVGALPPIVGQALDGVMCLLATGTVPLNHQLALGGETHLSNSGWEMPIAFAQQGN